MGDCLKGGLGQFVDLRGSLARKGVVFLRGGGGVDTPMPTMNSYLKNFGKQKTNSSLSDKNAIEIR